MSRARRTPGAASPSRPGAAPPPAAPQAPAATTPAAPRPEPATGQPARLVVLGLDPGSTTGFALVDTSSRGTTVLACGATRSPRLVGSHGAVWLDGQPLRCWPALVAIETVTAVVPRARFGPGMATALVGAADVAGQLAGAATALGLPVLRVDAATWRQAITGHRQASDAAIRRALSRRLGDALPRTNAHARDAIGLAIYAGQRARLALAAGHGPACDIARGPAGCGAGCPQQGRPGAPTGGGRASPARRHAARSAGAGREEAGGDPRLQQPCCQTQSTRSANPMSREEPHRWRDVTKS